MEAFLDFLTQDLTLGLIKLQTKSSTEKNADRAPTCTVARSTDQKIKIT
jgi:hypothetical protein